MSTTTLTERPRTRVRDRLAGAWAGVTARIPKGERAAELRRDARSLAGLALVAVGLAGIYWPLAPLAIGVFLLADAVSETKRAASETEGRG